MVVATKIREYRRTFLQWLALQVFRFPIPILIASVALAIVCGYWTATHLGYQTNPNDLLKPDARYHKNFLVYLKEFRDEEDFIIVVAGPQFERNRRAVDWIAERIKLDPDLAPNLFYKINFAPLEDRSLLFLDAKELEKIDSQLEQFAKVMRKSGWQLDLNSMLHTAQEQLDPDYMEEEDNWDNMQPFLQDFIKNLNLLADRLEGRQKGIEVESFGNLLEEGSQMAELQEQKAEHEYLSFNKGRVMLVTVMPERKTNVTDFFPNADTIKRLNGLIDQARAEFPGLEIGLTGEPVLAQDEMAASTKDCAQSTLIALVLISLLFFFAYREFWRPFFAIIALLIGVAWTMGFATVSVGHLNILSQAFVAMILGLGIDFGIQLNGRYEESLSHGKSVAEALEEMMSHTGGAIITGGSTTAAAFFTMCFNQFRGLAELGIIAGGGVLLCLASEMLVLPALLALRDRNRKHLDKSADITHWASGGIDTFLKKYARQVAIVAAGVTVLSIWSIRYVDFDYNLLNLQSRHLESVKFERKLLDSGSKSTIFGISITDNLEETKRRVDQFKKLPTVLDADSITSLIPENQAEKMKVIKRIRSRLEGAKLDTDVSKTVNVANAKESLTQLKEKTEWLTRMARKFGGEEGRMASKVFAKLTPPIDRALKAFSDVGQEEVGRRLNAHQLAVFGEMQKNLQLLKKQRYDKELTETDVPPEILSRFRGKSGKIMIQVYPKQNVWEREPLAQFVEEMRTVDAEVTGTPVQNFEYIGLLRDSYLQATGEALVAISILILIHFRSIRLTVLTLLPLGLGMAWTLLAMPILGLRFNPANIITLPLVVGAGVAYGVYTVDRYREMGTADIWGTSTGKAILLSAMTTIIGFGSLIPARHQGIASLGTLMMIGITMCMISALYVLPSLIELSRRSSGKPRSRPKTEPALR
jgi:hopanoid biosynthesis associated RND transporter like protein HpnN